MGLPRGKYIVAVSELESQILQDTLFDRGYRRSFNRSEVTMLDAKYIVIEDTTIYYHYEPLPNNGYIELSFIEIMDKLHNVGVDHTNPSHYREHPSGVQCIEITRHLNFNLGNAVKYIWRAGLKDGNPTTQDLKKAVWYLNDEIARLESKDE